MAKVNPAAEIFLKEFQARESQPNPALKDFTDELAENHLIDLQPTSGHFTPDTQDLLSAEAARRWAERCHSLNSRQELTKQWGEIVRDFHSNKRWNFPTIARKVKRKKPTNIATKMMITTFTSFVGTKCLVLFFGSREINEPSTANQIGLIIAVSSSFITLFYFAYKNGKAMDEENNRHYEESNPNRIRSDGHE